MKMQKELINGYNAIVIFDDTTKEYTVMFDGDGGAFISDKDINVAKLKFAEAMLFGEQIVKLYKFKNGSTK
jgi:hypothetical protein